MSATSPPCAPSCARAAACASARARPSADCAASGIEGIGTKTKAIVPIFVAGEFIGVVGFDNTRQRAPSIRRARRAGDRGRGHRRRAAPRAARGRRAPRARARRRGARGGAGQGQRRHPRQPRAPGQRARPAQLPGAHAARGHAAVRCGVSGVVIVLKDTPAGVAHRRARARRPARRPPPFAASMPVAGSPFTELFGRSCASRST